jgi:hypothetical protein
MCVNSEAQKPTDHPVVVEADGFATTINILLTLFPVNISVASLTHFDFLHDGAPSGFLTLPVLVYIFFTLTAISFPSLLHSSRSFSIE